MGDESPKTPRLSDDDIALFTRFSSGPMNLDPLQEEIDSLHREITSVSGVSAETDTGISPPSLWNLQADRMMIEQIHPLFVARVSKHMPKEDPDDQDRYMITMRHAKYLVGLGKNVSSYDIKEEMRVGVQRQTYSIELPLPPRIDATVQAMTVEERPDVTFNDLGGVDEQIKQIKEVVELPMTHPELFDALGIEPPKGVLLYGPPGTGKTLLARAVANSTGSTFIRVIGSELVQRYVGEGARLVRELFKSAKQKTEAGKGVVVFLDEVDAFAGSRFSGGSDSSDSEVERTLMELLTQLDGFEARGNIIILMATNRPDTLDPALTRPGRLDRKIEFGLPDLEGLAHIFKIHASRMPIEPGVRFDLLARLCPNSTGADVKSVCTEAGMFAMRDRTKIVTERHFLKAVEKVIKGYAKFSATPKYLLYQ